MSLSPTKAEVLPPMSREDYAALLGNPFIIKAVLAFNQRFLSKNEFPKDLTDTSFGTLIKKNPRYQTWFNIPTELFWDFRSEARRLALLPPETLEKLCLYFGASVLANHLSHIIKASEVNTLKSNLGPLYGFALKTGRFYLGHLRDRFPVPDSFMIPQLKDLTEIGQRALFLALSKELSGLPLNFKERVLSFPSEDIPDDPALSRQSFFWLKKILIREVAPECRPFFN